MTITNPKPYNLDPVRAPKNVYDAARNHTGDFELIAAVIQKVNDATIEADATVDRVRDWYTIRSLVAAIAIVKEIRYADYKTGQTRSYDYQANMAARRNLMLGLLVCAHSMGLISDDDLGVQTTQNGAQNGENPPQN